MVAYFTLLCSNTVLVWLYLHTRHTCRRLSAGRAGWRSAGCMRAEGRGRVSLLSAKIEKITRVVRRRLRRSSNARLRSVRYPENEPLNFTSSSSVSLKTKDKNKQRTQVTHQKSLYTRKPVLPRCSAQLPSAASSSVSESATPVPTLTPAINACCTSDSTRMGSTGRRPSAFSSTWPSLSA